MQCSCDLAFLMLFGFLSNFDKDVSFGYHCYFRNCSYCFSELAQVALVALPPQELMRPLSCLY
jgi:hypothetical protein